MANWNTPNNSEPAHENVLKALADKDTYSLTMGQAGGIWTNQPVGAMLWNNSAAYFQRWNGSNAIPVVISVAGGGTGASTAAQARANLGANNAENLTTGTLPAARLTGTYNINISGNAANAANSALLQGNNAAFYRNASNLNAGTVPAARLPLNNTVTSTSTTQAATANAVKTAYDIGTSGVRELTQSSNTGVATPYRIANPNYYGNIGNRAIDLSFSAGTSLTRGARGFYSTAMGYNTTASGDTSTAMGRSTTASGLYSTAMGYSTTASGNYSTVMGVFAIASGTNSTAMGRSTTASGYTSTAMGDTATASGANSAAMGYNCEVGSNYYAGWGYSTSAPSPNGTNQNLTIAFNYQTGNGYFDGSADLGNADYAEYFETNSGQPIDAGYFASWVEGTDKIEAGNNDVLGIVSAAPAVVGDSASLHWTNKYVKDEFDRVQWHDVEVEEVVGIDDNGKEITKTKVMRDRVLNPDYDPSVPYVPRSERPEWIPVGLLGKLWVRTEDSSIKVGDKVDAGSDGKAVKGTGWRVIGVRDGLVRVLFR